jgi:hypothetical protein
MEQKVLLLDQKKKEIHCFLFHLVQVNWLRHHHQQILEVM